MGLIFDSAHPQRLCVRSTPEIFPFSNISTTDSGIKLLTSLPYDTIKSLENRKYGWLPGWRKGGMDRWSDGWMDGWMVDGYLTQLIQLRMLCSRQIYHHLQQLASKSLIWRALEIPLIGHRLKKGRSSTLYTNSTSVGINKTSPEILVSLSPFSPWSMPV